MAFHILHISDIHFQYTNTSNWITQRKIIDRIRTAQLRADCILISGDLFHQGSIEPKDVSNYVDFIKSIKEAARKSASTGDQQTPSEPHVLVVPGNHDLNRMARKEIEGSYNDYLNRSDIVYKAGESLLQGNEYRIRNDDEKEVLYQRSFEAFQRFSKTIGSESFCTPDANLDWHNYEVQCRSFPITSDGKKVQFVLLNTALFAGQGIHYKDFISRRLQLEKEQLKANEDGDKVKAAELALQIARLQEIYDKTGTLIIDEEITADKARLGLSYDCTTGLPGTTDDADVVCAIFVGHHGLQFLSQGTYAAISNAMEQYSTNPSDHGIYLCGHAHQAQNKSYETPSYCTLDKIQQIQAGALHGTNDGYSEYGINYITIQESGDSNLLTISAVLHYRNKNHSKKDDWYTENLFSLTTPLPTRQLEEDTCKEVKHVPNEKKVEKGKIFTEDKNEKSFDSSQSDVDSTNHSAKNNSSNTATAQAKPSGGDQDESAPPTTSDEDRCSDTAEAKIDYAKSVSKKLLGTW